MYGEDSNSESRNNNAILYDYSDNKKSNIGKAPKFNGDPKEFSWWKTNFYSNVMSLERTMKHT